MITLDSLWLAAHLTVIIVFLIVIQRQSTNFATERETWKAERQMLLDRIQAPSFAEYTNKVVREKKAEQPKEEEKPIEFIS